MDNIIAAILGAIAGSAATYLADEYRHKRDDRAKNLHLIKEWSVTGKTANLLIFEKGMSHLVNPLEVSAAQAGL